MSYDNSVSFCTSWAPRVTKKARIPSFISTFGLIFSNPIKLGYRSRKLFSKKYISVGFISFPLADGIQSLFIKKSFNGESIKKLYSFAFLQLIYYIYQESYNK